MNGVGVAAARAQAARNAARPHSPRPTTEKRPAPGPASAAPVDQPGESASATQALADDAAAAEAVAQQAKLLLEAEQARQEFDAALAGRAELQREINLLVDLALEQRKRDDEVVRADIKLI